MSSSALDRPSVEIRATRSFAADLDILVEATGQSSLVVQHLKIALTQLKDQKFDALRVKAHGHYGDSFAFMFDKDYVFTYKTSTERTEHRPIAITYTLKNIFRAPSNR